jgi:hypothetical protein
MPLSSASGAKELAAAYGVDAAEQERLAIDDLLHTRADRVWISTDRPAGCRSSVRRLDAHLHCVSSGLTIPPWGAGPWRTRCERGNLAVWTASYWHVLTV